VLHTLWKLHLNKALSIKLFYEYECKISFAKKLSRAQPKYVHTLSALNQWKCLYAPCLTFLFAEVLSSGVYSANEVTSLIPWRNFWTRVAGVWVLSFVICFPPLVGWKDKREEPPHVNHQSSRPLAPATSALQVRTPLEIWGFWNSVYSQFNVALRNILRPLITTFKCK
jgi:hypothetical protein